MNSEGNHPQLSKEDLVVSGPWGPDLVPALDPVVHPNPMASIVDDQLLTGGAGSDSLVLHYHRRAAHRPWRAPGPSDNSALVLAPFPGYSI